MECSTLLADPVALQLQHIVSADKSITLVVMATQPQASCPRCHAASTRVHSRYTRRIADLPWHGVAVRLELHTRRFRCLNTLCRRSIFAQRLPSVVAHYGRKTTRLNDALHLIGFALGGEAGARTALRLGMSTSPDTLLRRIRQAALPEQQAPKVLGVDDFAKRKGQTYGTILVDLERRRPVELLLDREAETLAAWLRAHPGVEVVTRDRAPAYAEGIRLGAPSAVQIADRWHILKNMTEALERWLGRQRRCLGQAAEAVAKQLMTQQPPAEVTTTASTVKPTPHQLKRDERRADRHKRYTEIRELYRQGASVRGIAAQFGMHRRDVRQFINADEYPERATPKNRRSKLDKYLPYLQQRWAEGCHNSSELYREIKEQGFGGADSLVRQHIAKWRAHLPAHLRCARRLQSGAPPVKVAVPSPRSAVWLLLRNTEELKEEQHTFLAKLFEVCPEAQMAQSLARRFQQIVSGRQAEAFDSWLTDATQSKLPEVVSFAAGLSKDAAVRNALKYEWSNGQTEGQVNRLKLIKRTMYGRAKPDLLRARVLHAV